MAQAAALNQALAVFGRWLFGWALAHVLGACLLGRLRALNALLSWRAFAPVAALSYSAYLLQWAVLGLVPSWDAAGVTTLYAAWATLLLGTAITLAASLAAALPLHCLVERPFAMLWPRHW